MTKGRKRRLKKKIKRVVYKVKKINRSLLSECVGAFSYLLWLSTPPFYSKILNYCLEEQFAKEAIWANVHRLYRRGFISKIGKRGNIYLKLNSSPQNLIFSDLERLKINNVKGKWNGLWRLIVYDIPERERWKRDVLRCFLKELGFGKVKESCWVSPYNFSSQIHRFCKKQKILSYICLYEGKFFAGKNIDNLVEEVWGLTNLNTEYEEFISLCADSIERVETEEMEPKECYGIYFKVYSLFINIIRRDPFLPKEFVRHWLRARAESSFKKLSKVVSGDLLSHT